MRVLLVPVKGLLLGAAKSPALGAVRIAAQVRSGRFMKEKMSGSSVRVLDS